MLVTSCQSQKRWRGEVILSSILDTLIRLNTGKSSLLVSERSASYLPNWEHGRWQVGSVTSTSPRQVYNYDRTVARALAACLAYMAPWPLESSLFGASLLAGNGKGGTTDRWDSKVRRESY